MMVTCLFTERVCNRLSDLVSLSGSGGKAGKLSRKLA